MTEESKIVTVQVDADVSREKQSGLVCAAYSEPGARSSQQDSLFCGERDGMLLAAVCDGMGGMNGGEKEKTVEIIVAKIESVNPQTEDNSAYITLENNGGSWGEDYIAGVSKKIYPNIGSILSFLESKWIFFIFLIVPCFFILIYEIYLAIIEIKYGDEEEEDKEVNTKESDTIEDLKKQLEMLKQEVTAQKESTATTDSKVISDTPEKEITVEKKETKDELEDTIELL